MVLLLFSFSATPVLFHRSGNSYWLLCGLIHFFLFRRRARNQHCRKSHDKIGGKALLLDLILNFVCLFVCSFFFLVVPLIAFSSFLSFFLLFCDNLPCSGMFRNVPECSCSWFC